MIILSCEMNKSPLTAKKIYPTQLKLFSDAQIDILLICIVYVRFDQDKLAYDEYFDYLLFNMIH